MRTISVIGRETTGGQPTEITLVNEPPIGSILSGELLIALHDHDSFKVLNSETATDTTGKTFVGVNDGKGDTLPVDVDIVAPGDGSTGAKDFFVPSSSENATRKKLNVITATPESYTDGDIQLTDVDKFKLYLDTSMTRNDTLILKVMIVGEVMRP